MQVLKTIARIAALAALYALAGRLSLLLALPPTDVAPIFPAAGIGLALAIIFGWQGVLATTLGCWLFTHHPTFSALAAISMIAPTVQVTVGALLFKRLVGYPTALDQSRQIFRFFMIVPAICLISASVAVPSFWLVGVIDTEAIAVVWSTWYAGDLLGVLVFVPATLVAFGEPRGLWRRRWLTVALPNAIGLSIFVVGFVWISQLEQTQYLIPLMVRAELTVDILQRRIEHVTSELAWMVQLEPTDEISFVGMAEHLQRTEDGVLNVRWFDAEHRLRWATRGTPPMEDWLQAAVKNARPIAHLDLATPFRPAVVTQRGSFGVVMLTLTPPKLLDLTGEMSLFVPASQHRQGPVLLDESCHAVTALVVDREVEMCFSPTALYRSQHQVWQSWVMLVVGALFTALGGFVLLWLSGRSARVDALVLHRTEELNHVASHDPLTDLLNRSAIEAILPELTQMNTPFGVFFIDLDRFKRINDSLGHPAGDSVLMDVADRLRSNARSGDYVARLGGDEFLLVCPGLSTPQQAEAVAAKLVTALRRPHRVSERSVQVSACVGVARWPADGIHEDELVRRADLAMYAVKAAGRDGYRVFTAALDQVRPLDRLELEQRLRAALSAAGAFEAYFQPQFDFTTGLLVGAEVLARWRDGDQLILPGGFIQAAEELGLMGAIGQRVTEAAFAQIARWDAQGLRLPRVAINLSAKQLAADDIVTEIVSLTQRHRVAPSRLTIELTERMALDDVTAVAARLNEIRALGCRISLDDFGTGYAALDVLQVLPLDELKIDRGFINDLEGNGGIIAMASITLARALGLKTIAEGVEEPEQAAILQRVGCDEVQGYLYGRPMHVDAFTDLLRASAGGKRFGPTIELSKSS